MPQPPCLLAKSATNLAGSTIHLGTPMELIKNSGSDRVIDELRQSLKPPASLDLASPAFSLFAFAELRDLLEKLDSWFAH